MDNDRKLSQFISATGSDPGLAQDLLEGNRWNYEAALLDFQKLRGEPLDPPKARRSGDTTTNGCHPKSYHEGIHPQSPSPTRPTLSRTKQIEEAPGSPSCRLTRGISKAHGNSGLVLKARNEIQNDEYHSKTNDSCFFLETPNFTFTLPDMSIYTEDFQDFLERDLIDNATLVALERAGFLNWWTEDNACQRLYPLVTTGDGNCLLHAASLGMWGLHDRLLTLRKALQDMLNSSVAAQAFNRRWRWFQTLINKETGLLYSELEWDEEWRNLLKLASAEPRCKYNKPSNVKYSGLETVSELPIPSEEEMDQYESLEELHVFVLANVLRRPIIVVSDNVLRNADGEALAPIPFGGIYLPLQCDPSECHRSPLVLTFDAAHFSALVAMEQTPTSTTGGVSGGQMMTVTDDIAPPVAIPITYMTNELLPVHFTIDPGPGFNWGSDIDDPKLCEKLFLTLEDQLRLLLQYLDVDFIPFEVSTFNGVDIKRKSSSLGSEGGGTLSGRTTPNNYLTVAKEDNDSRSKGKTKSNSFRGFGSLGKTFGQKIRKNFASLALTNKHKSHTLPRHGKSGKQDRTATDNSNPSSDMLHDVLDFFTATDGEKSKVILVARISVEKHLRYHAEMVDNYLKLAQQRYDDELLQKAEQDRKRLAETRHKYVLDNECTIKCYAGCGLYGLKDYNYMCYPCYLRHKKLGVEETVPTVGRSYDNNDRDNTWQGSHRRDPGNPAPPSYNDVMNQTTSISTPSQGVLEQRRSTTGRRSELTHRLSYPSSGDKYSLIGLSNSSSFPPVEQLDPLGFPSYNRINVIPQSHTPSDYYHKTALVVTGTTIDPSYHPPVTGASTVTRRKCHNRGCDNLTTVSSKTYCPMCQDRLRVQHRM